MPAKVLKRAYEASECHKFVTKLQMQKVRTDLSLLRQFGFICGQPGFFGDLNADSGFRIDT